MAVKMTMKMMMMIVLLRNRLRGSPDLNYALKIKGFMKAAWRILMISNSLKTYMNE